MFASSSLQSRAKQPTDGWYVYSILAIAAGSIFWLVPNFSSAVAVFIQGTFLRPFMPVVMLAATKFFPPDLHISGIGFLVAFGASSSTILPFAVGAIPQAWRVQVMQPLIIGVSGGIMLLWLGLLRVPQKIEHEANPCS
jgi:fucose permease